MLYFISITVLDHGVAFAHLGSRMSSIIYEVLLDGLFSLHFQLYLACRLFSYLCTFAFYNTRQCIIHLKLSYGGYIIEMVKWKIEG